MKKSHLTLKQRYQIQAYKEVGKKQTEIADLIDRSKSVVCMEIQRNVNLKGKYKAAYANGLAEIRKERLKRSRKMCPQVEERIRKALTEDQWSP
ncbi:MAG: helix-turn-helix domain-containing protein, partial [Pedobacter sp.]|nr:helix-turn-helix domain-containing protein [Pedobacter sp.]